MNCGCPVLSSNTSRDVLALRGITQLYSLDSAPHSVQQYCLSDQNRIFPPKNDTYHSNRTALPGTVRQWAWRQPCCSVTFFQKQHSGDICNHLKFPTQEVLHLSVYLMPQVFNLVVREKLYMPQILYVNTRCEHTSTCSFSAVLSFLGKDGIMLQLQILNLQN